jgi:PAS domain S-box-containing protein
VTDCEARKTLLLVEDEAIIAMGEKSTLEKYGYRVLLAHSGDEAVAAVRADPGIDLILMDIDLGRGMDGTEAAALILSERDLPVVFLSSHMEPEIVEKTEKITSYGYVVKHSTATVLDASIKMAFKLFTAKVREKQKEAELLQRNRYIESILDNMPIGFAAHTIDDGVARYLNARFTEVYGWPREVLTDVDRFFASVYPGPEGAALKARVLADMASNDPVRMAWDDLRITTRDGRQRYISARNIPIPDQNLMVSTVWDTTAAHEAQAALRESEEQFRTLAAMLPVGIYLTDLQGRCLYTNPRWLKMAGLTMEEALGDGWKQGLHPEDREAVSANWRKTMAAEGNWALEYRFLAPDGTVTWVQGLAAPKRDEQGKAIGYVGANIDITASRRTEAELRESEERFRAIFDHSPEAVLLTVPDGTILSANAAAERLFGRSAEEIVRNGRDGIIDASDPRLAPALAERARSGRFHGELTFIRADGEKFPAEVSSNLFRDREGRVRTSMVIRDISRRKRAEAALHESEERLRGILFSMADWVWEVDETGAYTYSSDQGTNFLGYSREELLGRTPFDFMPAGEAERVRAAFAGFASRREAFKDLENWNLNKSGERVCLLTSGVPIQDDAGRLRGYRGVDKDITDRKKAEDALQNALHFEQALMEAIPTPVFYKDTARRYLGGNQAFADFIGVPRKRFIGKTVHDISPADLAGRYDQADRELLEQGGTQTYEAAVADAGGLRRDVIFHKAVFTDAGGRPAGIIGVIQDISKRKRVEEELRRATDGYETFISQAAEGVYRFELDEPMPVSLPVEEQIDHLYRHMILAECNPAFLEMYGIRDAAEVLGKAQAGLHGGTDNPANRAAMRRFIESGYRIRGVVTEEVDSRGNRKYFSNNSVGVVQDGLLLHTWGTQIDITDLKRTEKLMETLYGISQAVHSSQDLPVLYARIHELIAGIVNAGNFFIALLDAGGAFLEFPYFRDEMDLDSSPIRADDPGSLTVEVLRSRRPLLLDEEQLEERYATGRNRVWGTKPKCWLGIPLVYRDSIIGVMALQDYRNGRAYGPKELALLEATARQVAVTIVRKRTEDALRASEEAFKNYFNIGTVGMAVTSPDKGWIEVNDCLCRMLGYAKEELLRLTWAELTHPEDLDADIELFNGTMAGRRDSYELDKRFLRKDGRVIHTRLFVTCQRDPGGQVRHFLASLVDISERKQAEEALRRSEATQAAALQMTKSGHWEYDVERDLFTFNDNFYRIFRTTAAAVGGYQMSSAEYARRFCHPDDAAMVAEETRKAIEASDPGFNRQVEHRIRYADGETGFISVRFFIVKDDRGRTVQTYGVNQDISERKWAETEIKRQLEEKSVLLKEVHHRIKNNFASVAGLLALQAQGAPPEAAAALREAGRRVDSMRLLYDKLLLREDYKDVAAKEYVESLAAAVIGQFRGMAKVDLELDVADFSLPAKRLFPLGIILNELLTNIMKHAFAGGKRGRIRLSLARNAGRASLVLQDDGAGLPEGFDPETTQGFGLMLVRMLTKQLGGTFAMKSGKQGTKSEIAFDAG